MGDDLTSNENKMIMFYFLKKYISIFAKLLFMNYM